MSFKAFDTSVSARTHNLCEALLDEVQGSVSKFRPSESLHALAALESRKMVEPEHTEIDIVISGGGLKGYYMAGCSHILKNVLMKQNIHISRISGASAGAWAAMFMLTDFGTQNWVESYYACQYPGETMHEAYEKMWPWIQSILPEDAYKQCSGRLFISITELTVLGPRNRMISEFSSNEDLFQACLASSTVPFLTERYGVRVFRDMWVVDGGVTVNTPIFHDGARRQLVFQLNDVDYPFRLLLSPKDVCIESLVVRGAITMSRFLEGNPSGVGNEMAWVEKRKGRSSHKSPSSKGSILPLLAATTAGVAVLSWLFGKTGSRSQQMMNKLLLMPLAVVFASYCKQRVVQLV